jgi:hypothetical protein
MANFLRHIGQVGDRKVAVIFREVPNEPHMCIVVYTQLLNRNIHDPLMAAIESPSGQSAKDLADQLNRSYTTDGKIILQVLHHEGMMKKVNTDQVMMTPAPNTKIKLNELNTMLDEMEKGEEAVRRLAEMDASRGLQDPADVARRMRGESTVGAPAPLSDDAISANLREQAIRMANEAKSLLAESERLMKEASGLSGINTVTAQAPVKRGRGRPAKAAVTG